MCGLRWELARKQAIFLTCIGAGRGHCLTDSCHCTWNENSTYSMCYWNGCYCVAVPGDAAGWHVAWTEWGMWPQPWDSWLYVKARGTCLLGGCEKTGLRQTRSWKSSWWPRDAVLSLLFLRFPVAYAQSFGYWNFWMELFFLLPNCLKRHHGILFKVKVETNKQKA